MRHWSVIWGLRCLAGRCSVFSSHVRCTGTSHLDIKTEKAVNEAVSELGITRVIVAHRPQTIQYADRVLEIEGGKVREREKASL